MKNIFGEKLFTALLFFVLTFLFLQSFFKEKNTPRNIILISSDTLRPDRMGIYGYDKNITPNIDAWAKDATVFTNAYTVVPLTYPSFAAFMTGRLPSITSTTSNRVTIRTNSPNPRVHPLSNNLPTLAKILKQKGFTNGAFLANPQLSPKLTNMQKGFDMYRVGNFDRSSKTSYDRFLDNALNWLRVNKDKQTFFWIHLIDPHPPYWPPNALKCKFNEVNCADVLKETNEAIERRRRSKMGFECKVGDVFDDDKKLLSGLYDADIAYMDTQFKRIMDQIKKLALDKNSLIIFYSDHGEGFDHDYNFLHGEVLYDSNIKVALVMKSPFNKKGEKINNLIDNTDLLPTILKILNIPLGKTKVDGVSTGSPIKEKLSFLISSDAEKIGATDGRYKYIYNQKGDCLHKKGTEELYDLKSDPNELNNIVGEGKDITQKLRWETQQYMKKFRGNDLIPTSEQEPDAQLLEQLKSLGY